MTGYPLVPIILDWRALRENGDGVNGTGDSVKGDESPKEDLPSTACQTKSIKQLGPLGEGRGFLKQDLLQ